MKNRLLLPLLFAVFSSTSQAQGITYEAFTIAETLIENSWEEAAAPVIEVAMKQMEANLKEGGATDRAAKTFGSSMRQGFSREALSRLTAELITESMSQDEQKQALAFLKTSAGKKLMTSMNSQSATMNKFVAKLFKTSCDRADKDLGFFDRGSIKKLCDGAK